MLFSALGIQSNTSIKKKRITENSLKQDRLSKLLLNKHNGKVLIKMPVHGCSLSLTQDYK